MASTSESSRRNATMLLLQNNQQRVIHFLLPEVLSIPSILLQAGVVVPPQSLVEFRFHPHNRYDFIVQTIPIITRNQPAAVNAEVSAPENPAQQPGVGMGANNNNSKLEVESMDVSTSDSSEEELQTDEPGPSTSRGIKRKRHPRDNGNPKKRAL